MKYFIESLPVELAFTDVYPTEADWISDLDDEIQSIFHHNQSILHRLINGNSFPYTLNEYLNKIDIYREKKALKVPIQKHFTFLRRLFDLAIEQDVNLAQRDAFGDTVFDCLLVIEDEKINQFVIELLNDFLWREDKKYEEILIQAGIYSHFNLPSPAPHPNDDNEERFRNFLKKSQNYHENIKQFFLYIQTDNLEKVKEIIGQDENVLICIDELGRLPLQSAISYECENVVEYLVEEFPHLMYQTDVKGNIPLHYAAIQWKKTKRFYELLLQIGSDENQLNYRHISPAMLKSGTFGNSSTDSNGLMAVNETSGKFSAKLSFSLQQTESITENEELSSYDGEFVIEEHLRCCRIEYSIFGYLLSMERKWKQLLKMNENSIDEIIGHCSDIIPSPVVIDCMKRTAEKWLSRNEDEYYIIFVHYLHDGHTLHHVITELMMMTLLMNDQNNQEKKLQHQFSEWNIFIFEMFTNLLTFRLHFNRRFQDGFNIFDIIYFYRLLFNTNSTTNLTMGNFFEFIDECLILMSKKIPVMEVERILAVNFLTYFRHLKNELTKLPGKNSILPNRKPTQLKKMNNLSKIIVTENTSSFLREMKKLKGQCEEIESLTVMFCRSHGRKNIASKQYIFSTLAYNGNSLWPCGIPPIQRFIMTYMLYTFKSENDTTSYVNPSTFRINFLSDYLDQNVYIWTLTDCLGRNVLHYIMAFNKYYEDNMTMKRIFEILLNRIRSKKHIFIQLNETFDSNHFAPNDYKHSSSLAKVFFEEYRVLLIEAFKPSATLNHLYEAFRQCNIERCEFDLRKKYRNLCSHIVQLKNKIHMDFEGKNSWSSELEKSIKESSINQVQKLCGKLGERIYCDRQTNTLNTYLHLAVDQAEKHKTRLSSSTIRDASAKVIAILLRTIGMENEMNIKSISVRNLNDRENCLDKVMKSSFENEEAKIEIMNQLKKWIKNILNNGGDEDAIEEKIVGQMELMNNLQLTKYLHEDLRRIDSSSDFASVQLFGQIMDGLKKISECQNDFIELMFNPSSSLRAKRATISNKRTKTYCNHLGITPMHLATLFSDTEIIRELTKEQTNLLDRQDHFGRVPLHYSKYYHDGDNLYHLVETKQAANTVDALGKRPNDYDYRKNDIEDEKKRLKEIHKTLSKQVSSSQKIYLFDVETLKMSNVKHDADNNSIAMNKLLEAVREPLTECLVQCVNKNPKNPYEFIAKFFKDYSDQRNRRKR
ncbi:hypothetical protein SNEBB_010133 [Seison nebaliae]|nr:hypothetical protein SNEBB_010133 [Seison nebaliae]